MVVYVDTRWGGMHGIGRFANEVIRRLPVSWQPLRLGGDPWSPLDAFRPGRVRLKGTDLVYSPGYNAGLTGAVQLLTVHDLMHLKVLNETSIAKRLYYDRLVKPAILKAGAVMTVSQASKVDIDAWIGDNSVQVHVVGNGVSEAFRPHGPVDSRAENAHVFVGNLKPHKNFDVVLELLKLRSDLRVVAVVTDPAAVHLRIEAAGVADRVQVLHGLTDAELAALYRGSLGLLFPTTMEGFGLPALEAIACGRSVTYWGGGVPSVAEIVGANGATFADANDPLDVARALDHATTISQPDVDAGWLDRYCWDSVSDRVAAAITEIAGE